MSGPGHPGDYRASSAGEMNPWEGLAVALFALAVLPFLAVLVLGAVVFQLLWECGQVQMWRLQLMLLPSHRFAKWLEQGPAEVTRACVAGKWLPKGWNHSVRIDRGRWEPGMKEPIWRPAKSALPLMAVWEKCEEAHRLKNTKARLAWIKASRALIERGASPYLAPTPDCSPWSRVCERKDWGLAEAWLRWAGAQGDWPGEEEWRSAIMNGAWRSRALWRSAQEMGPERMRLAIEQVSKVKGLFCKEPKEWEGFLQEAQNALGDDLLKERIWDVQEGLAPMRASMEAATLEKESRAAIARGKRRNHLRL